MLSPHYQEHGSAVAWPQASPCSSTSQGPNRPPRCRPPPISGSSVGPNPTYYHAVYDVRVEPFLSGGRGSYGVHSGHSSTSLVTGHSDLTTPPVRRRGGVVDHRDIILAHQAHKKHNTPQARRKQWE